MNRKKPETQLPESDDEVQGRSALQTIISGGFTPRGGFQPTADDKVPDVAPERSARTVILVGNAGPVMGQCFNQQCNPKTDLLDDWTRATLDEMARKLGARAFYPFTKPHLPFLRWAQKAEDCHSSPLGILIHPDYGLWHGYRGALVFAEQLILPLPTTLSAPCDRCSNQPCLTTCPVGAFSGDSYDVASCTQYLDTAAGRDCLDKGCRARRACPIGRDFTYKPDQAGFHMTAFHRATRRKNAG